MINAITPVFLLMFLGWAAVHFELIHAEVSKSLMSYVYWVAGPAVIFSAISHYHLSDFLIWRFWIAYALLFAVTTALAFLIFKTIFHATAKHAMTFAYSSTVKNTVALGLPLLLSIMGNGAVIPVVITILFLNCLAMPAFVIFVESRNGHTHLPSLLIKTIKNPLVFASFAGIIFSFMRLSLPSTLNTTLATLSASFIPCALFALGADLKTYSFRNNAAKITTACFINLILSPLAAIFLSDTLHLSPFNAIILVILAATPTAQIMYVYASPYPDIEQDVAAIFSATTLLSLITLPFFVFVCHALWSQVFVVG